MIVANSANMDERISRIEHKTWLVRRAIKRFCYGTPTNMIEKIKELQLKIEDMEDEIHRLTTGFSKKWNDVAHDDLKSSDYLTKFDKKFDEYGYYGENNGPIGEHSNCGTDDCCKQC